MYQNRSPSQQSHDGDPRQHPRLDRCDQQRLPPVQYNWWSSRSRRGAEASRQVLYAYETPCTHADGGDFTFLSTTPQLSPDRESAECLRGGRRGYAARHSYPSKYATARGQPECSAPRGSPPRYVTRRSSETLSPTDLGKEMSVPWPSLARPVAAQILGYECTRTLCAFVQRLPSHSVLWSHNR